MDQRDLTTWVAVELSRLGEQKIENGTIEKCLRDELKGADESHKFFIPAVTFFQGNRAVTVHLMEGYVFIASGLPEVSYFNLERGSYVTNVMSIHNERGMRVLATIPNHEIESMRKRLREMASSNIKVGMAVNVLEGAYAGLEGEVVSVVGNLASVYFEMRSIKWMAEIPLVSLEYDEVLTDHIKSLTETPEKEPESDLPAICTLPVPESDQTEFELDPVYRHSLLGGVSSTGISPLDSIQSAKEELLAAIEEAQSLIDASPLSSLVVGEEECLVVNFEGDILIEQVS